MGNWQLAISQKKPAAFLKTLDDCDNSLEVKIFCSTHSAKQCKPLKTLKACGLACRFYDDLRSIYDDLKVDYDDLNSGYDDLQSISDALESGHDGLIHQVLIVDGSKYRIC